MSISLLKDRLKLYQIKSQQDETNALKEIIQEIALAALSRADFFSHAAFQGGTCLRIFYGLQRFSEDLDFVLKSAKQVFDWPRFLDNMKDEFVSFGIDMEIQDRKNTDRVVKKIFLKENSIGQILTFPHNRSIPKIRIKLEIDTNPPAGSTYDIRYLEFPYPLSVTTHDLPSLFAGKSHALLCREYIKGRDWYDFIWYVAHRTKPNFTFLYHAMDQNGPWEGKKIKMNAPWFIEALVDKIRAINWQEAQNDVMRFIKPAEQKSIELWSVDFFLSQANKLKEYL